MFNQFTELFQASLKPVEKLVELNIATANAVAYQQGSLIAGLIDDSVSYNRNMPVTTDVAFFVEEQSKFTTEVQNHLAEAIKQTSETLTKAQKDAENILNDSLSVFSKNTDKVVSDETQRGTLKPKAKTVKATLKVKTADNS